MFKRFTTVLLAFVALAGVLAFSGTSVSAETLKPWWHLSYSARPSTLQRKGSNDQVVLTVVNQGDAEANGASSPVKIEVSLPPGLKALSIDAAAGNTSKVVDEGNRGKVECSSPTAVPLTCTYAGTTMNYNGEVVPKTLPPYDPIEVKIGVDAESAQSGEALTASVSGGGAPPATLAPWQIAVGEAGEAAIPFGLQDDELALEGTNGEPGGQPDTLAGSHPFQMTSTIVLNQVFQEDAKEETLPQPAALPKDINVKLPAGLVGNPIPLPRCPLGQFLTQVENGPEHANACPASTVVGIASVLLDEPVNLGMVRFTVPLFNLEPRFGEPARFGWYIPITETPILVDSSVRGGPGTGEEYAIDGIVENIPQIAGLLSSEVVFWGVPSNPAHDNARGWGCLAQARGERHTLPCESVENAHPPALFTMPTSCSGVPLESSAEIDSWIAADKRKAEGLPPLLEAAPQTAGYTMQTLDGCNQLKFAPALQAEPTTDSASSASGLKLNLGFHDEGLTSEEGQAQSQMSKSVVTLPPGFTINPSAGVGLAGCTPADYERETIDSPPGAGCPNESKLGKVELQTPLLSQTLEGNIFIAQPYDNPFPEPEKGHPNGTLVALYIVIKNPETGVMIKLAGKVTPCEHAGETIGGKPCEAAGQLVTTFENTPKFPLSHFSFQFREGQQAPLVTPPTCGPYTTQAQLSPWSEPLTALTDTSSFQITSGTGGGACPTGNTPPFNPGIEAGTVNNNAGAFSPLYIHLTRSDSDAEISGFSTNMPPGLTGYLTGLPFCPEADIEAARHKTGAEEEANPSCPASTQIGHTLVGTGVGAVLAYVPGKVYFAGPFDGAPFSIVSVTSAKVGPFDLGTVVLRFGLNIDPYTAQVNVSPTSSEPIPTIIKGIVTHVRDIRVYVDRPNFIINPTNCSPLKIGSTLESDLGQRTTVTSPFQNASCGNLAFSPRFAVSTSGKTNRENGASLAVKLTYPLGAVGTYANIAKVKVELPKQLPSRLTTLQKACTSAQFKANPAGCPAASIVGHAKASTPLIPVPLEGPAYFVSNGGESFPNLVMVLQGYGVTIDLVGDTFINEKTGITSSTFKAVPDQPVGSFELTLPEGKYSALAANGSLCKDKLKMPTEFVAQNGAQIKTSTKIAVTGCTKAKKSSKHKRKKKAGHRAKGHPTKK